MKHLLGRAVVIGGGVGGLAAAGALAPYFREVEVFDRDDLPARAASRTGTPRIAIPTACWRAACRPLGRSTPASRPT